MYVMLLVADLEDCFLWSLILNLYPIILQQNLISILCRQTSIPQIPFDIRPLLQATIVEQFHIIRNDERNMSICHAFLEHDESAYTSVSVLEGVDTFETMMQVQNVIERLLFIGIVFFEQCFHFLAYILRKTGFSATHFIG